MAQANKRAGAGGRGKTSKVSATRAATRAEVEKAAKRFERALAEAGDALHAIRGDLGTGAKRAYKDVAKALKAVSRDAEKSRRDMLKHVADLRVSATAPAKAAKPAAAKPVARTARKPAASATRARKPAAAATTARKPAASTTARKPAASTTARKPAASTTARKPAASASARKPAASATARKPTASTRRTAAPPKPTG